MKRVSRKRNDKEENLDSYDKSRWFRDGNYERKPGV